MGAAIEGRAGLVTASGSGRACASEMEHVLLLTDDIEASRESCRPAVLASCCSPTRTGRGSKPTSHAPITD